MPGLHANLTLNSSLTLSQARKAPDISGGEHLWSCNWTNIYWNTWVNGFDAQGRQTHGSIRWLYSVELRLVSCGDRQRDIELSAPYTIQPGSLAKLTKQRYSVHIQYSVYMWSSRNHGLNLSKSFGSSFYRPRQLECHFPFMEEKINKN
jgi:hypothetical protein